MDHLQTTTEIKSIKGIFAAPYQTSLSAFSFPAIPWWFLSIVTMTVNLIKPQAILLGKATIFSKVEAVFNIFQDSGKPLT